MALIEEAFLQQTLSGTGRTNSIRTYNGLVLIDIGGSTCTVDIKMHNGTWIPLCAPDGTAYEYTNDIALRVNGQGREMSVNCTSFVGAVVVEIHPGS